MEEPLEPCHFVIFGATGNLARRKLLPALYRLDEGGHLHADLRFVATARSEMTTEGWLENLGKALHDALGTDFNRKAYDRFATRFDYVAGDLYDPELYKRITEYLGQPRPGVCENIVFYLSIRPGDFEAVIEQLSAAGFHRGVAQHRIVVEKPFGEDIDSARALNERLHRHFDEEQIYRIDHYLGKETVQNLLVFRFANTLIEPIWNRSYIDHVQITVAETNGIDGRGAYYDRSGALRDMLQNHLMQLLTLVAMEPPACLEADAVRDEKVKVLRSIRPLQPDGVDTHAFRAQYDAGVVAGRRVRGYLEDLGMPESRAETYAAAKFYIDNWRWRGVPFYLRTGKRLAERLSMVSIRFRHPPQMLFQEMGEPEIEPNWIVLANQPLECMDLELQAKQPGATMGTRPVKLNALYRAGLESPMEAYETLLLDVIEGDRTLFIRFDEVEWAWRVVDPILRRWTEDQGPVARYAAGTWGPEAADQLFERPDRSWRNQV